MKKVHVYCLLICAVLSCEEIVEVPNISNEIVTVLAPTDGVILTNTDVNFNWEPVTDAETYNIQIADPNFLEGKQILLDSVIENNSFTQTLESGIYQWRVKAQNSAYETNFTTQSFSVNTADISDESVTVLAPSDGAVLSNNEVSFNWEVITYAESYTIQVADPDFTDAEQILLDSVITVNSFTKTLATGTYQWRVKAQNSTYQTEYSTQSFTIE